jgi:hypothetical protein
MCGTCEAMKTSPTCGASGSTCHSRQAVSKVRPRRLACRAGLSQMRKFFSRVIFSSLLLLAQQGAMQHELSHFAATQP